MTDDAGPCRSQPDGERWVDTLVDLHVLAEHGDPDAWDAAARWMAGDPEARLRWDRVEQECAMVRDATTHLDEHRPEGGGGRLGR